MRPNGHMARIEATLLGTMILYNSVIESCCAELRRHRIFLRDPRHRIIFGAIVSLYDSKSFTGEIDLVVLRKYLRGAGLLEKIGGMEYLADLVASGSNERHAIHYVNSLVDYKGTEDWEDGT